MLIGILPVTSVALHALGWIHIQVMLMPNLFLLSVSLVYLITFREEGVGYLKGWVFGILAVLFYDLSRIPFICCGWADFIPGLGGWITGEEEDFIVGYIWRYLGNGAGLGLCFCVLKSIFNPKRVWLFGLLYGFGIFLCLDIILISSTQAQELMFKVTPLSFIGGLTGHLVYGLTLGLCSEYWLVKKTSLKGLTFQTQ
ncbi:MAG: hypothetical protein H6600_02100 [Flavobacteriales bacterium]|nr:hypothetical protein [Flavobacteriales bacterium]MCB9197223.1 hypothetical protein [Flavobacteriales bacterium]